MHCLRGRSIGPASYAAEYLTISLTPTAADMTAPSTPSLGLTPPSARFSLHVLSTARCSSGRRTTDRRRAGVRSRSTCCTRRAVRSAVSSPLTPLAADPLLPCRAVNAIAWAPHELGPILACASSDGKVSVLTFNSAFHFISSPPFSSSPLPSADDGTWEASLFPAHSLGVTSVSWAPGVGIGALTNPQAGAGAEGQEALQVVKRFATGGCDGMVKIWAWK